MKKLIALLPIFLAVFSLSAQSNLKDVASSSQGGNWWRFQTDSRVSPDGFFEKYSSSLGLSLNSEMILLREDIDQMGMKHQRYEQFISGVKVEASQFILHVENGFVKSANGRLVSEISTATIPSFTFDQAIEKARVLVGANKFFWEMPAMEQQIKDIKGDLNATYYPKEELVFVDPTYSQDGENYTLAYKLDLYFDELINHKTIFLDALDGSLLLEIEGCHTGNANGTAHTKYYGVQSIVTDSIGPDSYVLRDNTRGGGIETYDLYQGTNFANAQLFHDSDNVWNNFNARFDEVATDVHWGSEMVYDYFLNVHGRDSYDGNGAKLISYVHYDSAWFNAGWTGQFMVYGDGDSIYPLTSIDVTGHEIAHGVTNFSANLTYFYESGALNESFSDIFGTAIEFFGIPDSADWLMGKHNFKIRSMSNPNAFYHPDTYLADTLWHTAAWDNGGVHINSGVQNFWFYNLCVGGNGTNKLGNQYSVDSIGMDKAAKIAFRNLVYYLTPASQFYDSRQGSIEAAADLYGNCSNEVIQTAKAWYAVGVGPDTTTQDLRIVSVLNPSTGCDLGSQEQLTVNFTYKSSGCDTILNIGDSILVSYRLNGGSVISEYYNVASTIQANDTISYTFNYQEDFSQTGTYILDFWTEYNKDQLLVNDSIIGYVQESRISVSSCDSLTFEPWNLAYEETFSFVRTAKNSSGDISTISSNGLRGFALTGQNIATNFQSPTVESENFIINPEYQSDLCLCVDASNWTNVKLKFDLRQTYSVLLINDPLLSSSLRVTVNGEQIGDQYHPVTFFNDPFASHSVNLDQFAGQAFQVCFEGKHYFNAGDDFTWTQGDHSYLDHIVVCDEASNIDIPEFDQSSVRVYPNPGKGIFHLRISDHFTSQMNIEVHDQMGRVILNESKDLSKDSRGIIDLSHVAPGVYYAKLSAEGNTVVKKLIIQ